MAPILFRFPASWETEISLQSRYPGGIFVTKIGAAESVAACRDEGAVSVTSPASITTATSSNVISFIVVLLQEPCSLTAIGAPVSKVHDPNIRPIGVSGITRWKVFRVPSLVGRHIPYSRYSEMATFRT